MHLLEFKFLCKISSKLTDNIITLHFVKETKHDKNYLTVYKADVYCNRMRMRDISSRLKLYSDLRFNMVAMMPRVMKSGIVDERCCIQNLPNFSISRR